MKILTNPTHRGFSGLSALLAALIVLPTFSISAADYFWSGGTGTYNNPVAWGGTIPGVADRAINDSGAANVVQINVGDPDWILNGIRAGLSTGDGAFVQNGQTVYLTNAVGRGAVRLGVAPGRSGAYTINDGALNFTGDFIVGELGTATLTINGGTISGNGLLAVNAGTSLDAVNATMDGGTNKGGHTWFEQGFYMPDPTRGLPPAGSTVVSVSQADHTYALAPSYAANNSVFVYNQVPNGTITLSAPTTATALSFLGSSGGGAATLNYTIHFSGGAPDESGTLVIPDWYPPAEATVAVNVGGRVQANGFNFQNVDGAIEVPKLVSVDLSLANTTSPITSIDLTYVSGGRAGLMALSRSTGDEFTPLTITGYNADIVMGASEPVYVANTVTNVLTQVAGSINTTGEVWVGNYGAGVYNLSDGTNNFGSWTAFGRSGGHGVLNMTGGVINKTGGGNFLIGTGFQAPAGSTPSGIVIQSGGTINTSGEFMIPENAPATGEYHLSGTGVLNVNNWMQVGRSGGTGFMTMTGGTVNKTGGGNFIVGDNATGTLNQSGGTITVNNQTWIGQAGSGNGTYNMSGGSLSSGDWIAIGRGGGVGVLNLTNGAINKLNNGNFAIGSGGTGTLNQYGGAISNTVNPGSITFLGEAGGNGSWYMYGGEAYLGVLQFCQNGNGIGNLFFNGGLLNVREINCGLVGANGAFYFNGGTLQANADNVNFFNGLGATYMDVGGAVIDSQEFDITIGQTISDFGGGGLTKLGPGRLTLTGFNGYSGATLVNEGTLAVTTDSAASGTGGYTVASGATLAVKVQFDEAQLNAGSATFNAGTTLDVDLGNFGNPTAAPINLFGNLAVNGTVTINLIDSLPQLGRFPLIKYGSKNGAGNFVIGNLPTGVLAVVEDNAANSSIDINITTVNAPRWDGQDGGNWDVGVTTNWVNIGDGAPTFFAQGNPVIFNDLAAGTTTANIVGTVNPSSVTFDNSALSYTLTGSGKISGSAGLTKQGSGVTTLANTGNDFTGKTVIAGGTLSVASLANGGSPSSIGASSSSAANLEIAGGTLAYTGPNTAINRGYTIGGTNSAITINNNLSLSGAVVAGQNANFIKFGPGELAYTGAGSNVLSGAGSSGYWVQDGTVRFEGVNGAQTNVLQGGLSINGISANASVVLTNTTVLSGGNVDLGNVANTVGTLNIDSNVNLIVGSWLVFGDGGDSTNTVNLNGGTLNVNNGTLLMGGRPNTTSTLNINSGVLNKSGGTVIVGPGNWNGPGARTGIINQSGGTFTFPDEIQIGQDAQGTGIYNLHGGAVNSTGWFVIGRAGGVGTMNMDGGVLTHTSGGQPAFIVGSGAGNNSLASVGVLNHSAGTINCSSEYWVAENTLAVGTNNISGSAEINLSNWMSIGRGGLGVVNFFGGTFTKTGNGNFIVGDGGTGYFNQTDGALSINSEFWIGQGGAGAGFFNMSGGTVALNNYLVIGREGAPGTMNLSGGTFTKTGTTGNFFTIGASGSATAAGVLNQTGGTINDLISDTRLGRSGAGGTWNMSGGTANLNVLRFGNNPGIPGTLNLNGGVIAANEFTIGAGLGTNNLNGGTLRARSSNANFMHHLTQANVLSGGVTVDSAAFTIGIAQPLLDGGGNGGLTKIGAGTLNLNGVNTYTGPTLVSEGALGGTGVIAGPVNVASGATLSPGTSIGTLTINNTLNLAPNSTTFVEVSLDGGANVDLVTGLTAVAYDGTLVVANVGATPLVPGSVFKIFESAAVGTGNFDSVIVQPGGSGTFNPATGEVTITSAGAPTVNPPVNAGGFLVLTGGGGAPGTSYTWISATNVAAPITEWVTNTTGVFDGNGAYSNAIPISPNEPARFFRLQTP